MSQDSLVSVIIPVYNRPETVKDAIESVLWQTYADIEIIVVDDSSDAHIEKSLVGYLPLIKLIRNDSNMGVSYSRNIGVKHSNGKYIAFLDSDDIWIRSKISDQLNFMKENKYLISHTNEFWFRGDKFVNKGRSNEKYGGDVFCSILDKCRIAPSSTVLERQLFYDIGGFNEELRVCEDYDFCLRVASSINIGYLDKKLIVKRAICGNSLSASIQHIESVRLNILNNLDISQINDKKLKCYRSELSKKMSIVKQLKNE